MCLQHTCSGHYCLGTAGYLPRHRCQRCLVECTPASLGYLAMQGGTLRVVRDIHCHFSPIWGLAAALRPIRCAVKYHPPQLHTRRGPAFKRAPTASAPRDNSTHMQKRGVSQPTPTKNQVPHKRTLSCAHVHYMRTRTNNFYKCYSLASGLGRGFRKRSGMRTHTHIITQQHTF